MHPACPAHLVRPTPNKKPPIPEPVAGGYLFRKMDEVNKRGMQWVLKNYALVGKQLKEFDTQDDSDHHFNDVSVDIQRMIANLVSSNYSLAPRSCAACKEFVGSPLRERVACFSKSDAHWFQAGVFQRFRG